MVAREKAALDRKEEVTSEVVAQLQSLSQSATYPLPQTILVTEDKISQYLHQSTKRWNSEIRATDGIWWGYQDPSFLEHYSNWVTWYWKNPSHKGILTKIITQDADAERSVEAITTADRQIRFVHNTKITGSLWACGHSIILINTSGEKHYLTEIIDPVLAANNREMFRLLWEGTAARD